MVMWTTSVEVAKIDNWKVIFKMSLRYKKNVHQNDGFNHGDKM